MRTNAKQSLFGVNNLETSIGKYPHVVLQADDIMTIDVPISLEQVKTLFNQL
jgi:hypothetical protein